MTRGLLSGGPRRTEGPSLHCTLTSFVDRPHTTEGTGRKLVSSADPLAQRYQRETFTNPEGRVFLTAMSLLRSRHGERKRGKIKGRFTGPRFLDYSLIAELPSLSETPRAGKPGKVLAPRAESYIAQPCPRPLVLPSWVPRPSGRSTLHKSHIYSFVFVKLAGLLYLPSKFSGGSF